MNNAHIKQYTEKERRDSPAYSNSSAEIKSGSGGLFKAAFEEVMSVIQQNIWACQDPDSSPRSLCCVPQTLQTHWQIF